ncbi:MAG: hypothetical protein ACJA1B_000007 [Polaribacter sp.]|jgi:hypothetical protein
MFKFCFTYFFNLISKTLTIHNKGNGTTASVSASSDTSITTAVVPYGATSGDVTVITGETTRNIK